MLLTIICYMPSSVEISPPVPEKILKGFYHIWAWQPSWSCDPLSIDDSYKICFLLEKKIQKRRSLHIIVTYMYIAPGLGQTIPWGPSK